MASVTFQTRRTDRWDAAIVDTLGLFTATVIALNVLDNALHGAVVGHNRVLICRWVVQMTFHRLLRLDVTIDALDRRSLV